jgi:tetratricopeptide (TPR) repeat protein
MLRSLHLVWPAALLAAALVNAAGAAHAADLSEPDARFLRAGLQLVLDEDRAGAERLIREQIRLHPEEPLPRVALMFLLQLEMYELDNFQRERELELEARAALQRLRAAIAVRGRAWDHLLEAAVHGMRGLLEARRERWLAAARLGLKAKGSLERALRVDPELADARLGLGVYQYFGSVVTRRYWFLPGFGDQRSEGLREVLHARGHARYLAVLAELALLYIYYEERRYAEALSLAQSLLERHPRNALAQSWVGWMQMRLGRYAAAAESFRRVRAGGAGRYHCQYHLGHSMLLEGRDLPAAAASLQAFLATEPSSYWRARAYYRLGTAHLRLRDHEAARRAFQASSYIDPSYRPPRQRLKNLDADGTGLQRRGRGAPDATYARQDAPVPAESAIRPD